MARVIVTSALPYANGPIHFGHVVGAYLPADIYVRLRRMCGDDVHYVCGADEHGVAITLKAEQCGQPYEAYVDGWQEKIATLRELRQEAGRADLPFDITGAPDAPPTPDVIRRFEEIGVTRLMVGPYGYPDASITAEKIEAGLEQFANDVLSKLS